MGRKAKYREVKNMAFLRVSTYQGVSLGAIHWYGEILWDDECGDLQSVDLDRILTEGGAKKLNAQHKKACPGIPHPHWMKGVPYYGFDSPDDVRKAAIEKYEELDLTCGLAEGTSFASVEARIIHIEKA